MENKKQHLFDNPKNIKRLLTGFYICCGILLLLDFVIHRHTYHSWEELWGFYPLYGFVGCVILVFVAKWMRIFIMKDEDYYDKIESPGVKHPDQVTTGDDNVDA